jgi:hypothetical protein
LNRRRSSRVPVHLAFDVYLRHARLGRFWTRNVSQEGLFLGTSSPGHFPSGVLDLLFHADGSEHRLRGIAVHKTPGQGVGVQIAYWRKDDHRAHQAYLGVIGAISDRRAALLRVECGVPNKAKELTAHGFRSTFRDWAGEATAYPREVIELSTVSSVKWASGPDSSDSVVSIGLASHTGPITPPAMAPGVPCPPLLDRSTVQPRLLLRETFGRLRQRFVRAEDEEPAGD